MEVTFSVTTCVVVWIEILSVLCDGNPGMGSPPAWWCGLKSYTANIASMNCSVTTCVVVWIEIDYIIPMAFGIKVTTCVVVWIEICQTWLQSLPGWRHHLRGGVD